MKKQIEELAKELCPHYANGNCYYEANEVDNCDCECEFCWAVSKVLNAGYRKIPEGAVVIEKLEYEKMRLLADECLDWRRKNCNVDEIAREITEVDG